MAIRGAIIRGNQDGNQRPNKRGNQMAISWQSEGQSDGNHLSKQRARIESDERREYVGLAVPDEGGTQPNEGGHQKQSRGRHLLVDLSAVPGGEVDGHRFVTCNEGGHQKQSRGAVPGGEVDGHRFVSRIAHTRVGAVVEDRLMMEAISMQSRTAWTQDATLAQMIVIQFQAEVIRWQSPGRSSRRQSMRPSEVGSIQPTHHRQATRAAAVPNLDQRRRSKKGRSKCGGSK